MPTTPASPTVLFASLGGTITMTGDDGVTPSLAAADLLQAAPDIASTAAVRAQTVATVPGASLSYAHLDELLRAAGRAVDEGAVGVVVSQGTDTIEETAYYLDLRWDRDEPIIVTGAMRAPQMLSADGPSNLGSSFAVASDPAARGLGVVVVLDEQVHSAAWVRKTHSSSLSAFQSPVGPLGFVVEGRFERVWSHQRRRTVPAPVRGDVRIAALSTGLGDDGTTFRAVVDAGVDGVVIEAFGAGHVPMRLADAIADVSSKLPVVVSTRTGSGRTLRSTYAFPGSERDLAQRGALMSGWLDGRKSGVLLHALLAAGLPLDELRSVFSSHGEL